MGITIHWNGSTDRDSSHKVIGYAKFFADSLGWESKLITEDAIAQDVIINYNNSKTESFRELILKSYRSYETALKNMDEANRCKTKYYGVIINPKEPFNTDSIDICFYEDNGKYVMQEFCKTQVFSNDEVANLIAHQLIISMLMTIKATWINNLEIYDEGDFYIPLDPNEKKQWLDHFKEEYRKEYKSLKPYNFERLSSEHSQLSYMMSNLTKLLKQIFKDEMDVKIEGAGLKSAKDPFNEGR